MMILLNIILIITAFFSTTPNNEWELRKEENNIKVYTRNVEGSSFKEFKAITVIKRRSMTSVLDIIFDVKNYDHLFPNCKGQKVLKQISRYHNIQYLIIKTPWPVSDRDNVTELEADFLEDSSVVNISIKLRPQYIEEEKDLVRVDKGNGFWKLYKLPKNDIKVIYQYHGNPGGGIPAWLANSFVVKHPYKTLLNLINRIK